jgi:hypothetical protein
MPALGRLQPVTGSSAVELDLCLLRDLKVIIDFNPKHCGHMTASNLRAAIACRESVNNYALSRIGVQKW